MGVNSSIFHPQAGRFGLQPNRMRRGDLEDFKTFFTLFFNGAGLRHQQHLPKNIAWTPAGQNGYRNTAIDYDTTRGLPQIRFG